MRGDTATGNGEGLAGSQGGETPLPRQLQQIQDGVLDVESGKVDEHLDDDDLDGEGSDEEVAGLVSRLSDEEERSARRARNEGVTKLGRIGTTYRAEDDEEEGGGGGHGNEGRDESREDGFLVGEAISPFTDRREQRKARRKPMGIMASIWAISREALPTLAISVLSLVFSGELLIHLARWPVFVKVDKLFILIPILLNLKGNLEGNLSLRMSTSANIGELDIRRTRETLIFGNLALLQVQALIVSLFAGILAFVLGVLGGQATTVESPKTRAVSSVKSLAAPLLSKRRVIHHHPAPTDPSMRLRNSYFEFVLVIATGMLAASMSSAILGSFMCALVVVTRQVGGNPDNIASPLAGSLGDLLTLTILGLLGSFLVRFEGTILATLILIALSAACAFCFVMAYRNAYVRELLSSGWVPLLIAMFISSGAGLVLDAFVQRYEGFALLTPVATGLPGACSAIFVSRISTALHSGKGATLSLSSSSLAAVRDLVKIGPTEGWLVPLTLFTIGAGIESLFLVLVWATGQMSFGWPFALAFVVTSGLIVAVSLYISHLITLFLWSRDYDPDIYCLPYVTSIVDVIGQALLVLAFASATALGDQITAAVNDHQGP